jgi:hypothetical protein
LRIVQCPVSGQSWNRIATCIRTYLVCETSLDKDSPETDKLRNRSAGEIRRSKSTGLVPVLEADVALLSNTTRVNDDGENPESDKRNDLDGREPELELAENVDRQEVDSGNWDPEDGDENADVEAAVPPLDDQASRGKFERICDGPRKPVDPSHSEAKTGVHEASSVLGESTSDGKVGGHFRKTEHDRVDESTDEDVCEQCADRSSGCDGTTAGNEDTGTDGSANCDELQMPAGEVPLQAFLCHGGLLFDIARRVRDRFVRGVVALGLVALGQDTLSSGSHRDGYG